MSLYFSFVFYSAVLSVKKVHFKVQILFKKLSVYNNCCNTALKAKLLCRISDLDLDLAGFKGIENQSENYDIPEEPEKLRFASIII